VYWFDVYDGGKEVPQIAWVKHIVNWKRKWDFPGRHFIKSKMPRLYKWIQKINERDIEKVFEEKLLEIKPDVVHSFAMQVACLPILEVMLKYPNIHWMYSSWGSDVFYRKELGIQETDFQRVIKRINSYTSDCHRDYNTIQTLGFSGKFLGIFPGNGGISMGNFDTIKPKKERKTIFIKVYDDGIGQGNKIIQSFDSKLIQKIKEYKLVLLGANQALEQLLKEEQFQCLQIMCIPKEQPIANEVVLELLNDSLLYIGNSLSDGMPNLLLEAMSRGAFPIQSNPGRVTEEVIVDGKNGFLIHDSLSTAVIRAQIHRFFDTFDSLEEYQKYNHDLIDKQFNRNHLQPKIQKAYDIAFQN
jgi:glycosyltransferase involved in cell wall biosynthesis